jgi:phosphate transport system permease protein
MSGRQQRLLGNPRRLVDRAVAGAVALGGLSVLAAILLIFVYLASVAAPLLGGASIRVEAPLPAMAEAPVLALGIDDNSEYFFSVHGDASVHVRTVADGSTVARLHIELPPGTRISRCWPVAGANRFALEVVDAAEGDRPEAAPAGPEAVTLPSTTTSPTEVPQLLFVDMVFPVLFIDDRRAVRPALSYPFTRTAIPLGTSDQDAGRLHDLAVAVTGETLTIATLFDSGAVTLMHFAYADPGVPLGAPTFHTRLAPPLRATRLFMGSQTQWLYLLDEGGDTALFDVTYKDVPDLVDHRRITAGPLQTAELLLGGMSLLVTEGAGTVTQWFPAREAGSGHRLRSPRRFSTPFEPNLLLAEPQRKGFLTLSARGELGLYHSTAERTLLERPALVGTPQRAALSSGADLLIALTDAGYERVHIHNPHPEISLRALWGRVWYEGYAEPIHAWQSASANDDFEPKYGLTPLAFGTLKAALYAMLVAVPLAVMGAIYTAYFMAPVLRGWVKPTIEILEALPTVILGFLAGLWLAPLVERNLAAVLTLLVLLPVGTVLTSALWVRFLPSGLQRYVPDGWHAVLLLPVLCGLTALAFTAGPLAEDLLFAGDLRGWLLREFDLPYDQRNALIVGFAMGLAIIPTVFSIAEDAIFNVPRHLINGSLALGATPWQTLARVVLLTASPGIFSAVMIGFGRAVGETMIVLMATGNTPVLDLSPFQGMRTFSANIAVELPESEVHSTHYRILFLAALLLFAVTFLFNTAAELVRQRLRARYGNL